MHQGPRYTQDSDPYNIRWLLICLVSLLLRVCLCYCSNATVNAKKGCREKWIRDVVAIEYSESSCQWTRQKRKDKGRGRKGYNAFTLGEARSEKKLWRMEKRKSYNPPTLFVYPQTSPHSLNAFKISCAMFLYTMIFPSTFLN